jgi:hypothetical protein
MTLQIDTSKTRLAVYAVLIAFGVWSIYLYFFNLPFLTAITREDSVTESLSAVFYLTAAALFFVLWVKLGFRNIFVLGYALLFLVVGGEEISWGQRIIGIQTPDSLAEVNVQRELNLHNIDGINQHIRIVALAVVLGIAILMPLAERFVPFLRGLITRFAIPVVPAWTIPITLVAVSFMAVPRVLWGGAVFALDEIGELYLSVVFLIFALARWRTTSA